MKSAVRLLIFHACAALVVFGHAAIAADCKSVAAQHDGKIVVAGDALVGRADQFAVMRYNSDGSLDKSFNHGGKLTTAVGTGTCRGEGVALQADGKIVVVGSSFNAGGQACFTVLRCRADGSLDTSFGDSGKLTTSVGSSHSAAKNVTVQSDGKIVVAGDVFIDKNNNDFAVVRYNPNGTLDTSFNETGKTTADFGSRDIGRGVAMHNDDRIVVAGYTANESKEKCALVCFKTNGTLDTSFNGTGKVTTDFGGDGNAEGQNVTVQTDGKIVVVGYATTAQIQQFALARFNADGTLDRSFGVTGRVITAVAINGSNATAVSLQKDGKIVVAGYAVSKSGRGYDFACVRYNTDGNLDQSFGDGGKVTTSIGHGDGKANSLALQSDSRILLAGFASKPENNEFAVVRYDASGKLDMSFNAAGNVLTAVGSESHQTENTGPRATMATIDDPDGYTNVRNYDGKVIAKAKKGERFIAVKPWNRPNDPKWSVRLKSGITGFMDQSRIHLLPDEPLMKLNYDARKKEWRKSQSDREAEQGETASEAKRRGLKYYDVLTAASGGDKKALAQFFSLAESMDGAAAEGYFPDAWELFHVVGDKTFAEFLRHQPLADQVSVRGTLIDGLSQEEFADAGDVNYLQRYFPETTKLLFRGEIVDWSSPDGRYSIRKTFTNPLDLTDSKVSHAELIEKATGHVLLDLTDADIGAGSGREGNVLWSPDSKRFAYESSDLTHPANLFQNPPPLPQKVQTIVYQISGKSFAKVDLPLQKPPGKESDAEIKGAVVGHEFVSPVRWTNANTLVLERHDYYQKLALSPESSHNFARLYEITISFKDDGTASTSWKLRDDRQ